MTPISWIITDKIGVNQLNLFYLCSVSFMMFCIAACLKLTVIPLKHPPKPTGGPSLRGRL